MAERFQTFAVNGERMLTIHCLSEPMEVVDPLRAGQRVYHTNHFGKTTCYSVVISFMSATESWRLAQYDPAASHGRDDVKPEEDDW